MMPYFVTSRRAGVSVLVGAIGEIENVSQVFHPDGPVLSRELAITLQIEIALHIADREQKSDLWTDTQHARPESTELGMLAEIVGDLLIAISDQPDENLFGEKLRIPQSTFKSIPFWYCVS